MAFAKVSLCILVLCTLLAIGPASAFRRIQQATTVSVRDGPAAHEKETSVGDATGAPASLIMANASNAVVHESSVDPRKAAQEIAVAICVERMAGIFQNVVWKHFPESLAKQHGDGEPMIPLVDTLAEYRKVLYQLHPPRGPTFLHNAVGRSWDTFKQTSELSPWSTEGMIQLKQREQQLGRHLGDWGFKLNRAEMFCTTVHSRMKPMEETSCIEEVKKTSSPNLSEDVLNELEDMANKGVALEMESHCLSEIFSFEFMGMLWSQIRLRKSFIAHEKKQIKQSFSADVFPVYQKLLECEVLKAEGMDSGFSRLGARILMEMRDSSKWKGGRCVERGDGQDYCPEGTGPKVQFPMTPERAGRWAANGALLGKAGTTVGGGVAGFLAAGPPGALKGWVAGATNPLNYGLASVAYMAGAYSPLPSCRCFNNPCEMDPDTGSCSMHVSDKSSNPFQRLPYPGQKCVKVKGSCQVILCSKGDMESGTTVDQVVGIVGERDNGVYNCLSLRSSGVLGEQLSTAETIPYGLGSNKPTARAELYRRLQVPED